MRYFIIYAIAFLCLLSGSLISLQNPLQGLTDEEFLQGTDAFYHQHIDRCDKKSPEDAKSTGCNRLMESGWNTFCHNSPYHDKQDFCKNGKLEGYLKKHGLL